MNHQPWKKGLRLPSMAGGFSCADEDALDMLLLKVEVGEQERVRSVAV